MFVVPDSENSANTQKMEPSQDGHDTGEENMLKGVEIVLASLKKAIKEVIDYLIVLT